MKMLKALSHAEVKGRLRYVVVAMVLLLVLHPFLQNGFTQTIVLNVLVTVVCIAAIYAVSSNRTHLVIASVFAVPWFVTNWVSLVASDPSVVLLSVSTVSLTLFYAVTAAVILSFVLSAKEISGDILYGAVSVYLLIGGAFAMLYVSVETLAPGSFVPSADVTLAGTIDWSDLLYYSFTTLTTMGYGDIVPRSPHAKSLATLEAVVGVMYVATIIARLVGLHTAHAGQKKTDQGPC